MSERSTPGLEGERRPSRWRCQRCRIEFEGNRRHCPGCGYTVYDPLPRQAAEPVERSSSGVPEGERVWLFEGPLGVRHEAQPEAVEELRASGYEVAEFVRVGADNGDRELREAMASALTSLETGPLRDGYAAAVLRAALAGGSQEGGK